MVSARRPAPSTTNAQPAHNLKLHKPPPPPTTPTTTPQTEVLPPVEIGSPPPDFPFKLAGFTDVSPEEFVYARTPGGNWIAAATDPSGRLYMIDEVRGVKGCADERERERDGRMEGGREG